MATTRVIPTMAPADKPARPLMVENHSMHWMECVPNVSEGQRPSVIAGCADAIRGGGSALLDVTSDVSHHRSVYTFAGHPQALHASVTALFASALATIDLRTHHGQHPRLGVVDVVPFVPLGEATMADAVALARHVGADVADRFGLPVYLYEDAAVRPGRRRLEAIRRGGFEGLASNMSHPEWTPDFGPSRPHPTGGASVIGARPFLIAFNVNLRTNRLDVAKHVARTVRESSGGLPAVKALGLMLADRDTAQVSMNLTDFRQTSITAAFDAVRTSAATYGVDVLESELIGLAPEAALSAAIAAHVHLSDFTEDRILEVRLAAQARHASR